MKQFREANGGGPRTLTQEDILLKERARANAKSLAFTNLPSDKDDSAEGYLKSIRAGYENVLSREIKKVPANADLVADLELKASEEKSSVYQDKLAQAKKQLHTATLELSEMDTDDGSHINKAFIWIGIVIIAFGEAFLTYKSVGGLLDVGNNAVLLIILLAFTVLYGVVLRRIRPRQAVQGISVLDSHRDFRRRLFLPRIFAIALYADAGDV